MSIVITGSPGVGKHTVTKKIAKILELPIIDINKIAEVEGLVEKNDDANEVDTKKMGKRMREKISRESIIVGHLGPYVLEKNQVKIMIVLRRDPYELISVYKERGYAEGKIRENAGSEVLGIIAHDATIKFQEKAFQINISGRSIQEVVDKILSLISSNKCNEEVDWLDTVTKNNDLDRFFVD